MSQYLVSETQGSSNLRWQCEGYKATDYYRQKVVLRFMDGVRGKS